MGKLIFIKSNTEILSVDAEDLSHIDYDSTGTISLFFEIYQLGELATAEVKLTVKEGYEKEAINDISVIAKNASVATFSNLTRYSNQIDNKGNRAVLPAIQASRYVLSVESISYINSAGSGTGIPSGGDTGQFLRKTSDTDYDTEWSDVHTMYITVRNVDTGTLYKGTPVHATGVTGNTPDVVAADASSASLMPATYVLNENIDAGAQGQAIIAGEITKVDTSLFDPGDVVYVAAGGGFTNVKPTGANLIQNLGIVTKSNANTGSGVVYGSGRSNDVPNLPNGKFFIGSAANTVESAYTLPVTDGSNGQVLTTNGSGAVSWGTSSSGTSGGGNFMITAFTSDNTSQWYGLYLPYDNSVRTSGNWQHYMIYHVPADGSIDHVSVHVQGASEIQFGVNINPQSGTNDIQTGTYNYTWSVPYTSANYTETTSPTTWTFSAGDELGFAFYNVNSGIPFYVSFNVSYSFT